MSRKEPKNRQTLADIMTPGRVRRSEADRYAVKPISAKRSPSDAEIDSMVSLVLKTRPATIEIAIARLSHVVPDDVAVSYGLMQNLVEAYSAQRHGISIPPPSAAHPADREEDRPWQ